jgi:tetratricopeptide (TPR) repeat protein
LIGPAASVLYLVVSAAVVDSAEEHYRRAAAALSASDYSKAASELRDCVRIDPKRAEFQYAFAVALSQTGDLVGARQAIEQCLRLQPAFRGAHLLAGQILAAINNPQAALPYFQEAQKTDPSNPEIMNSLGLALADLGKFKEAARQFSSLTQLKPDFPGGYYNLGLCFINLREFSLALTSFQKLLKLVPNHEKGRVQLANALLADAQQQASRGPRLREAAEAYRDALQLRPRDPDLHFNLAFALARLGDNQSALEHYNQVVRLQPNYALAHFNLGLTCYLVGDWSGAEEHLREALEKNEQTFWSAYYLGSTLVKLKKIEEAEIRLTEAASQNGKHAGVHFQLASLYRLKGELDRARKESRLFQELSAQEETERNVEALQSSAKAALETGDLVAGINALKRSYETRPDAVSARSLGLAYLQLGDLSEARRLLSEALQMSPRDAVAHNYLGLLESREGKPGLAKQHFERAVALDSSFVEALYNAAVAAANLGETDLSIRRFKEAVTLSDSPRLREVLAAALERAGRLEEAKQEFEAAERLKGEVRLNNGP